MTTYASPVSRVVGGRFLAWDATEVVPDGCWTWFTDPRAVVHGDDLYIGWVDSVGTCGISKHAKGVGSTHFSLSSIALEDDDHNNTAVHILQDGRILALYGKHNDSSGVRYRISTNPYDISAWGAQVILAVTTPITYFNPHYLSATGKTYMHYRSGGSLGGTIDRNCRAFDGTTWDAERTWIAQPVNGAWPYIRSASNGVDRIDFLITDRHPIQGLSSVYHCYMKLDGATELFYKSDGTLIGAGPVTPPDCTLIYDGSTIRGWVWEITYGADGHPRVVFTRFPSTTDHRYMFSRWTGSAWTAPVEITTAGTYLYSGEPYYSGGIGFDGRDPNTVYLSKQVGSAWEVQAWKTTDDGATWALSTHVTTDSGVKNCRPWSPRSHGTHGDVLFWSGTYLSYTNYNTSIVREVLK